MIFNSNVVYDDLESTDHLFFVTHGAGTVSRDHQVDASEPQAVSTWGRRLLDGCLQRLPKKHLASSFDTYHFESHVRESFLDLVQHLITA